MKKFHFFKKNNYSTNTQAFHYDKKNMIKYIILWILLVAIAWYIMTPSIAINGPGLIFWSIAITVLLKMISIMFSNKNGLYSLNEILFKGYAHTSIISKVLFYLSNLLAAVTVIWIFVSPIVFSPVFLMRSHMQIESRLKMSIFQQSMKWISQRRLLLIENRQLS